MNTRSLAYYHPVLYRRSLLAVIICMTTSGVFSMFGEPLSLRRPVDVGFTLPPVADTTSQTATLTRLPGSDGSAQPPASTPAVAEVAAVTVVPTGDMRSLGRAMNAAVFGDSEWGALEKLWTRESNWNPQARNRFSGACGIPQALPCSKIPDMSPQGQIHWGLQYIRGRYGTPSNAWRHSQARGWY